MNRQYLPNTIKSKIRIDRKHINCIICDHWCAIYIEIDQIQEKIEKLMTYKSLIKIEQTFQPSINIVHPHCLGWNLM